MGIFQVYGAQSIPADKIETTPTPTDLIEVRDATNTNDATAISIFNAVRGLAGALQYDEVTIPAADITATPRASSATPAASPSSRRRAKARSSNW